MTGTRIFLTLILACTILAPLTIPQLASSQSVTTVTRVQYLASSSATIVYSTVQITATTSEPVHYHMTPSDYSTQTGSFSLGQMKETIPQFTRVPSEPAEPYPCLYYDDFVFNATAGQEIHAHFATTQRTNITFYVLNTNQLQLFNAAYCGYGNWGWIERAFSSSYDLDWVVPRTGEYALLFASRAYNGPVYFRMQAYSTTVQSSTVTYATTRTHTVESNEIIASTLTSPNPQPSPTSSDLVAVIVPVLVALIVVGVLIGRGRKRQDH